MKRAAVAIAVFSLFCSEPFAQRVDWCSAFTDTPGVTYAKCDVPNRRISISGQGENGQLYRIDTVGNTVRVNGGPWISFDADPKDPLAGLEYAAKLEAVQQRSELRGKSQNLVLCLSGEVRIRSESQTPVAPCASAE